MNTTKENNAKYSSDHPNGANPSLKNLQVCETHSLENEENFEDWEVDEVPRVVCQTE